jgi:hypothetical protein
MKSKTLMALAVAGTFACGGALAGGFHHGGAHTSTQGSPYEVQTPASVDESAPWLANLPHTAGWSSDNASASVIGMQEGLHSDGPVGMSSSLGGTGSGGYDSTSSIEGEPVALTITEYWLVGADDNESTAGTGASSSFGGSGSGGFDSSAASFDSSMSGDPSIYGPSFDTSMNSSGGIDYWLFGDESYGAGASSSFGGAGSGGFDSAMSDGDSSYGAVSAADSSSVLALDEPVTVLSTASADEIASTLGETTPLLSEHYLVSSLSDPYPIVLEVGPAREDIALLDALSTDFFVLTPFYDEG